MSKPILIFIIYLISFACQNEATHHKNDYEFILSDKIILQNPSVIKIINDYLDVIEINNIDARIVIMDFFRNSNEIKIVISTISLQEQLSMIFPVAYFKVSNEIILVNNGFNSFCSIDTTFLKLFDNKKLGTASSLKKLNHYPTWEIKIGKNSNQTNLQKHGNSLYDPFHNDTITFVPPKIMH